MSPGTTKLCLIQNFSIIHPDLQSTTQSMHLKGISFIIKRTAQQLQITVHIKWVLTCPTKCWNIPCSIQNQYWAKELFFHIFDLCTVHFQMLHNKDKNISSLIHCTQQLCQVNEVPNFTLTSDQKS